MEYYHDYIVVMFEPTIAVRFSLWTLLSSRCTLARYYQGPILATCFNLNPGMDK